MLGIFVDLAAAEYWSRLLDHHKHVWIGMFVECDTTLDVWICKWNITSRFFKTILLTKDATNVESLWDGSSSWFYLKQ